MKVTWNLSSFAQKDPKPLELLRAKGIEPAGNPYKRAMTAEEVIAFCSDADGIIAGTEPLNEAVLGQLPRLKVISRCGAGMDNVDLRAAEARGIKVFNTPGGPTRAVAELAVGLMLTLLRQTGAMDRALRAGVWEKKMGNLLLGKTVGIIGYGRIGRKLAELLGVFGVKICWFDPAVSPEGLLGKKCALEALLKGSDIVTVHASGNKERPLLGCLEIAQMKKGSWLMNLSRGGAVDEAALAEALSGGRLAGAALDVFGQEPYQGSLTALENIIVTPHIGSYAAEARALMEIESAENLLKGLGL